MSGFCRGCYAISGQFCVWNAIVCVPFLLRYNHLYLLTNVGLPSISLVMGVKNVETSIVKTLDSILTQDGVDLEVIIINDGSSDNTESILKHQAFLDSRIRLLSRENRGLTISLIEGCSLASGEFIARHDANDISLPGRFAHQVELLKAHSDASFCSTYVRHVTKEGYEAMITKEEGIIHGSVLMRRSDYTKVGGYRKEFYYTQDLDLWSRLSETGTHIVIPKVYYEGLMYPDSISATKSKEQARYSYLIDKMTKARKEGKSDDLWLSKAEQLSKRCKQKIHSEKNYANGAYFIGSCMLKSNPHIAREYFTDALRHDITHIRARLKLAKLSCSYQ